MPILHRQLGAPAAASMGLPRGARNPTWWTIRAFRRGGPTSWRRRWPAKRPSRKQNVSLAKMPAMLAIDDTGQAEDASAGRWPGGQHDHLAFKEGADHHGVVPVVGDKIRGGHAGPGLVVLGLRRNRPCPGRRWCAWPRCARKRADSQRSATGPACLPPAGGSDRKRCRAPRSPHTGWPRRA